MSAPKNTARWGVAAKLETTYGTRSAPTLGVDSVLVTERPDVRLDYVHNGERAHSSLRRGPKLGRFAELDLVAEGAGAGAAYTAAVFPALQTLLRLAGYDATFSVNKWDFTPTALDGVQASATLDVWARGQKWELAGAMATLRLEVENGAFPKFTFGTRGIVTALPVDVALPAMAYAAAQLVDPPKAAGLGLTIGAFNPARIRSLTLNDGRTLGARALDNTTGNHGGFQHAAERPVTLEVLVESAALATYNPYQLAEAVDSRAIAAAIGGTANRRFKLAAANAQIVGVPEQDEENAAMWNLQFELKPTGFGLVDTHTLTWD